MQDIISVKGLVAGYKKVRVFDNLNLTLQGGHIYGLLGKNGSGKSTLLRSLHGLRYPKKGDINVLGHVPRKREPSFLHKIFMVPEEFYLPNIHIKELADSYADFYPRFNRDQFEQYLTDFEVPLTHRLQHMSYGQKKKVLISLGLATNAPVLFMDEPTNGLDIISKSQFRKIVAGVLNSDRCIIISTHQVRDLENLIDAVVILESGKILFNERMDTIGQRLSFMLMQEGSTPANALYSEASLNGIAAVLPNERNTETKTDLELLYKAVMHDPAGVKSLFEKEAEA
jgi:ABC-2 type transport system ATP-binding protein